MWIPVRVKQNDNVGRTQVNAQTTRPCAQQEQEFVAVRPIEVVDADLTILVGGLKKVLHQNIKAVWRKFYIKIFRQDNDIYHAILQFIAFTSYSASA